MQSVAEVFSEVLATTHTNNICCIAELNVIASVLGLITIKLSNIIKYISVWTDIYEIRFGGVH